MSGNNRYIRIAQQPPAIVVCGAPFTFIAYCPKSNFYSNNTRPPYGSYQDDVMTSQALDGQEDITYHNGFFATAHVIPATTSGRPSSWSEDGGIVVTGKTRAEFNAKNENDRTVKFEFAITRTGIFTTVVRLHKRHIRHASQRVGGVSGGNHIVTSVVTRRIQVVDKLDRQEGDDGTTTSRAGFGRLTPPAAVDLSAKGEEKEFESSFVDGPNLLREGTKKFNGRTSLAGRETASNLPKAKTSGDRLNGRSDMKSQSGSSRLVSTPSATYREKAYDDSKSDEDTWSDDDESEDDGGVRLP